MRWYIPSWNGDMRLVPHDKDPQKTLMMIVKPTLNEQKAINAIGEECRKNGWIRKWEVFEPKEGFFSPNSWEFEINATLEQLSPIVATIMRPGPAVLTAIKLSNDEVITCSGGRAELQEFVQTAYRSAPGVLPAPPVAAVAAAATEAVVQGKTEETKPEEPKPEAIAKPEAAATVKRHTPCCPSCVSGSIEPATEVLLAFLTEEQHRDWAKKRSIIVEGGLSGCRYRLSHRHSRRAQRDGRICYDLDTDCVVHFHDWTVPPEEEVLAAKLILEHREPWLRNEATMFEAAGSDRKNMVFKNPFGGIMDGVEDSRITSKIGKVFELILSGTKRD